LRIAELLTIESTINPQSAILTPQLPSFAVAIPAQRGGNDSRGGRSRPADLPDCDGCRQRRSDDDTAAVLSGAAPSSRHLCNLGYGRAIQTAVRYDARRIRSA
jgi:hypothetical protein